MDVNDLKVDDSVDPAIDVADKSDTFDFSEKDLSEKSKELDLSDTKAKVNAFRSMPPSLSRSKGFTKPVPANSFTTLRARASRGVSFGVKGSVNLASGIAALFDPSGNSMRRFSDNLKQFVREHAQEVDKFRELKRQEKESKKQRSENTLNALRGNIMGGMMSDYQNKAVGNLVEESNNSKSVVFNEGQKAHGDIEDKTRNTMGYLDEKTLDEIAKVEKNAKSIQYDLQYEDDEAINY